MLAGRRQQEAGPALVSRDDRLVVIVLVGAFLLVLFLAVVMGL